MVGLADVAKLNRAVDEVEDRVAGVLRGKTSDVERRALRSEIERVVQRLDELRNRLGG